MQPLPSDGVRSTVGQASGLSFRSYLTPDLALIGFLVTVLYCLFLFDGTQKLFRDSDSGWHIRVGELILQGHLPRAEPFSFTRAGEPWFAWEWGSDLIMGAIHRMAGLSGVALFYALAIGGSVWLWFRLTWVVGGNFLIAAMLAAPMLSTSNIHWLARPHVLSWLFMLSAVIAAESVSAKNKISPSALPAVAGFAALWANLHATFFFAPLIALIYSISHALRPLLWTLDRDAEWRKSRYFCHAALVAAVATFLNPYGWELHRHLYHYLTDSELLARVGEFQSFNFHAEGAFQILLTVGIAMLGGILALGQKNPARFLLAVMLIAAALRSARGLPLIALLLLPLANSAIAHALATAGGLRPELRRRLDSFLAYSGRLRLLDARLNGIALIPVVAWLFLLMLRAPAIAARTGFPPDQFPVAAAGQLELLPLNARLLAPDKFGGYLIYRFQGKRKVFFDGRSDLYGSEFLKQYARLVQLRPGWKKQLDTFGFTHALLPNDYSLVEALEGIGWKRIYRDDVATLLSRER